MMRAVSGTLTVSGQRVLFTLAEDLPKNHRVRVEILPYVATTDGRTLKEAERFHFTTALEPMYATIELIRTDVGGFLGSIADDEIAWTIHRVSKWADQVAARPYGSANEDFPGEVQQATDNRIFFQEYTRYESEIRLLLRRVAEHVPLRGETTVLGEVQFREPGSLSPELSVILTRLEARRNEALRYLKLGVGSYPLPVGTALGRVRRPFPLAARRSF